MLGAARAPLPLSGWGSRTAYVDTLNGKNITGRVRCEGAVDDQAPPRRRVVAGDVPSTRTGDSGEFTFSACSDPI